MPGSPPGDCLIKGPTSRRCESRATFVCRDSLQNRSDSRVVSVQRVENGERNGSHFIVLALIGENREQSFRLGRHGLPNSLLCGHSP